MRILYIFPHPDDESFGPSRAIATQRRQGHDVFLLTLTRGEATKVRHKFGWTLEQMGEARYRELLEVKKTLDLNDLRVLQLPDSGLKELDPWVIGTLQFEIDPRHRKVGDDVIVQPTDSVNRKRDKDVWFDTQYLVPNHLLDHPWVELL